MATIQELLTEGRRLLAERVAREEAEREAAEEAEERHWDALKAAFLAEVGAELADKEVADDTPFSVDTQSWTWTVKPFGAVPFYAAYRHIPNTGWGRVGKISIPTRLRFDPAGDPDHPCVLECSHEQVDSVAEAVALCDQYDAAYRAVQHEYAAATGAEPLAIPF